MSNFAKWLEDQLVASKINQADLAAATHSTPATISRLLGGSRNPSPSMCMAIAQAFKLPPEQVLSAAGIIPKGNSPTPILDIINHRISLIDRADQQLVIDFIDMLIKRNEDEQSNNRSTEVE